MKSPEQIDLNETGGVSKVLNSLIQLPRTFFEGRVAVPCILKVPLSELVAANVSYEKLRNEDRFVMQIHHSFHVNITSSDKNSLISRVGFRY